MYFKDTTLPKMVTSVRPPLIPDGYQTESDEIKSDDFLKNPLFIGGIVLIIIIILMIWKK